MVSDAKIVCVEEVRNSMSSLIFSVLANPCANNPCGSNGECIQSNGGFYCECNLGFYGNRCERTYDEMGYKGKIMSYRNRSSMPAESLYKWWHV